jgi:hypothetical protein
MIHGPRTTLGERVGRLGEEDMQLGEFEAMQMGNWIPSGRPSTPPPSTLTP